MGRTRKLTRDLLLPGATGWERWTGAPGDRCVKAAEFGQSAGVFARDSQDRALALPAAHLWVLPAWMEGESAHLKDMAALHLERLGVRVADVEHGLHVGEVTAREGGILTRLTALKETGAPLWDATRLPHEVLPHFTCLPLPEDGIVLLRELGRLVILITHGAEVIYASPLSARELDARALGEVNLICVQLGFQGVLSQVREIQLWLDDGHLDEVMRVTGLPATRVERPVPVMPAKGASPLMPPEILHARATAQNRSRVRLLALSVGFAMAAVVAVMAVLTSWAVRERNLLRERVAELTPRASQVLEQKRAWLESAPAADPAVSPMQVLLEVMEPDVSAEISMTNFEWTPERVLLRGRTPTPALALEYATGIKDSEPLTRFTWETPAPVIASDNSATFELKGEVRP